MVVERDTKATVMISKAKDTKQYLHELPQGIADLDSRYTVRSLSKL